MLGGFHMEKNFFVAIGKVIEVSKLQYILSESSAIVTGSLSNFLNENMYYHCSRTDTVLLAALCILHIQ